MGGCLRNRGLGVQVFQELFGGYIGKNGKNMETTVVYWAYILYSDNGKEDGNYNLGFLCFRASGGLGLEEV